MFNRKIVSFLAMFLTKKIDSVICDSEKSKMYLEGFYYFVGFRLSTRPVDHRF